MPFIRFVLLLIIPRKSLKLVWFITFLMLSSHAVANTLHLGFYKHQAKETIEKDYAQFFKYLDQALPNHQIQVHILDGDHLLQAVRNNKLDMLFVNPNLYEEIRYAVELEGVTATIQRRFNSQNLDSLGGVVFTRTKLTQINQFEDLEGLKVAIPSTSNTGAYRIPLHEVVKSGVDVNKIEFLEVGHNDSVVDAVMSGKIPVGMVRTGILEKWESQKGLDLTEIKVLNLQKNDDFPQLLSTSLYPEWPFIIMPSLDENLKRDITVALFSLRAEHPAAQSAGITGFIAPKDYLPFENLLIELRLPPFDQIPELSLTELIVQHKVSVASMLLFFIVMVISLMYSEKLRLRGKSQAQSLEKQAAVDKVLLEMPFELEGMSEKAFMDYISEQIEHLTESNATFLNFVDEEKGVIYMTGFSQGALSLNAHMKNYEELYPIHKAGVWADAIRKKKAVIINDYPNYAAKKGLPSAHMQLDRVINLVVTEKGKSVMLAGVTGKASNYSQYDVDIVQMLANQAWQLIKGRRSQKEIQFNNARFSNLINELGDDYVVFSHSGLNGVLSFVSDGVESVFGITPLALKDASWNESIKWLEPSLKKAEKAVKALSARQVQQTTLILEFIHPDGDKRIIKVDQHGVYNENQSLISINGLVIDITKDIKKQKSLTQAALVFNNTIEGIVISDANNEIVRVNNRFEEITGYRAEDVIGKNPRFLSSGKQDKVFYQEMWHDLLANDTWQGELWNRKKNGQFYVELLNISVIRNQHGEVEQFIALMSDISLQKDQQELLERRAYFDDLTDLPNRALLSDRITQGIAAAERHKESFALLFVDLDGFKEVNDVFGHQAGDFLLKAIAQRFLNEVRKEDTVARIGGDEFVIALNRDTSNHDFKKVERRLLRAASDPVVYHGQTLNVSCSLGSVHYQPNIHGEKGSESLLRLADQAMYLAKKNGKNQIYNHKWEQKSDHTLLLKAMEEREFELYFQPKVNFMTGDKKSFEGLIRWHNPERGVVSPAEFLPQINDAGLEIQLGDYVLHQGLLFVSAMAENGYQVQVSLNITGNYIQHFQFVDKVKKGLAAFPEISANQISFELLESSALEDLESITEQILAARQLGVRFAIDDFGTGHATLTYLKNLPVNELKIDQEFTFGLFEEANNLSIIEASKSMADAFDLSVVVEGAETEEHIVLLLKAGLSVIQGYGIARPMPMEQVLDWLKTWQPSNKIQNTIELKGEQKELLKAELMLVTHINKVFQFAKKNEVGEVDSQLALSPESCQFGRWLQSHAVGLLNKQTRKEMDKIHRRLHSLYLEVLASKRKETIIDLELTLREMEQYKEQLLTKLYAST